MFVRTARRVVWVSAIAAMVNGSWLVSEIRNPFGSEHLRRLPLAHGMFRRNRTIPVAGSLHGQVRRRARNSNARLHYGALPGPTPSEALASKISLDREHITSYHHARGRRGSGPRKAFPARNPPTRQRTNGLIARRPMAG